MPDTSLTLTAVLLGKARTAGDHLEVTLKIQQNIVTLRLLPDEASLFPDLSTLTGGGHPLYDPTRVVYTTAIPSYRVTISPVEPEPAAAPEEAPEASDAEPSEAATTTSEPDAALAAASIQE